MNVLVVDIGGTHVKVLATGQGTKRAFVSGPTLTPKRMVFGVRKLMADWKYDVISIKKATFEDYVGVRGLVKHGKKKWRRYVTD